MSTFLNTEDGYYSLTGAGKILAFVLVAALVIATALIRRSSKKADSDGTDAAGAKGFSTRQLAFSAVSLALAFALSYIRLIPMPWGGAVTPCSMFFVTLIGYWYGPKVGLTGAFAYSLLQFVQDGATYILSPLQACLDYLFAFTALGASGFFRGKKSSLQTGYLVAIILRGLFHTVGGYLYWMEYMPDNFPKSLSAIYPFCYNFAYIGLEGIITCILIAIPAVRNIIGRVTLLARSD